MNTSIWLWVVSMSAATFIGFVFGVVTATVLSRKLENHRLTDPAGDEPPHGEVIDWNRARSVVSK